jgi:hypothetical protein
VKASDRLTARNVLGSLTLLKREGGVGLAGTTLHKEREEAY